MCHGRSCPAVWRSWRRFLFCGGLFELFEHCRLGRNRRALFVRRPSAAVNHAYGYLIGAFEGRFKRGGGVLDSRLRREILLACAAHGAHPVVGQVHEGSAGLDTVRFVALVGVVNVSADVTDVFLHRFSFLLQGFHIDSKYRQAVIRASLAAVSRPSFLQRSRSAAVGTYSTFNGSPTSATPIERSISATCSGASPLQP